MAKKYTAKKVEDKPKVKEVNMFDSAIKWCGLWIKRISIICLVVLGTFILLAKTSTVYIDAKTSNCYISNNIISELIVLPLSIKSKSIDSKGNVISKTTEKIVVGGIK